MEGVGVTIDHLDTHQNLHLWPVVRDVMLEVGEERGIKAVRVTRSAQRRVVGRVVRRLSTALVERCDRGGWSYPHASTGLDDAGHLDTRAMVRALDSLAASGQPTAELATHPGEHGDADLARYRWGYSWGDELDALCSGAVRDTVDARGFVLGTFADLVSRAS
jgi:predicted glycoside hydrolase/deacetylase ChbG (UPF0249 family)